MAVFASSCRLSQLAPIQIEYESENFSLPVKVDTLNTSYTLNQNMILYFLSSQGEVSATNYSTQNMPNNIDLPISITANFNQFYNNVIHKVFASHPDIIRKEYAWPMSACKPCTSTPLSIDELQKLGVFWYKLPKPGRMGLVAPFSAVYVTRLYMQYSPEYHLSNLVDNMQFKETTDKIRYQTYFNIKHQISMAQSKCGEQYYSEMQKVETKENENLYILIH